MEKVKEFFKNNKIAVTIIIAVLLIAIIAVAIVLVQKNGEKKKEEQKNEAIKTAINDYMIAFNELDKNKMLSAVDSKAACAWANCEADTSRFKEQYDKVTDEDKKTYEENNITSRVEMLKSFYDNYLDYHKVELVSIEETKDIDGVEGLSKSTAKIKEVYSYDGQEQTQEQSVYFYIYNGKVVSMEEVTADGENVDEIDDSIKDVEKDKEDTKDVDNKEDKKDDKKDEEKPAA